MSGNIENTAKRTWDEVPEPSLYPTGTWRLRCVSTFKNQTEDGDDIYTFYFIGVEAMEDVDREELAEAEKGLDGQRIKHRVVCESNADFAKLRKLLTLLAVDTNGKDIDESVKEAKGNEAQGYVSTRSYFSKRNNETVTENVIRSFAPVGEMDMAA